MVTRKPGIHKLSWIGLNPLQQHVQPSSVYVLRLMGFPLQLRDKRIRPCLQTVRYGHQQTQEMASVGLGERIIGWSRLPALTRFTRCQELCLIQTDAAVFGLTLTNTAKSKILPFSVHLATSRGNMANT